MDVSVLAVVLHWWLGGVWVRLGGLGRDDGLGRLGFVNKMCP